MSLVYIKSVNTHKRLGSWHIKDGDTGKTLCGYEIVVEKSQGEPPEVGCCPRCLSIRVSRARQAREAQQQAGSQKGATS